MTSVTFDPTASFEIADAMRAYEATRPGLGRAFLQQVDAALGSIRRFPELAASCAPSLRRAVIYRFPYCLVYRLQAEEVQVLAVFPTRADPERLLARLLSSSNL